MNAFVRAMQVMRATRAYVVNRISLAVVEGADALEIGLRWGPGKPDVVLSFQNIFHLAISRTPGEDAALADVITPTLIPPADEPWPPGLPLLALTRDHTLPDLLWVHIEGLITIDVVASIATVLTEPQPEPYEQS